VAILSCLCSCGDTTSSDEVEFSLMQTLHARFDHLEANTSTRASLALPDLSSFGDFETHQADLVCLRIEADRTELRIKELSAPGMETVLALRVSASQRDADLWELFAAVDAPIAESLVMPAADVVLNVEGEQAMEAIALSSSPAIDLAIDVEVSSSVDALEVEFDLALFFSTSSDDCAKAMELSPGPQGASTDDGSP